MQQWSIRQAKDKLSALLQAAQTEPQAITIRGISSFVVLTQDEYDRLLRTPASALIEFFGESGLADIEFERVSASPREGFER